MTAIGGKVKGEGSTAIALLVGLGPLVVGALLAYGVWLLTGRLVGRSFVHYLWRLPLCACAFCYPLGVVVTWMFGQRDDVFHHDNPDSPGESSPRNDR